MIWKVNWSEHAVKELKNLDKAAQKRIVLYLKMKVATDQDPTRFGDALRKNLSGLWKYRVGTYRIICQIQDEQLIVLVVRVDHRRKVYKL